MLIAVNTTLIEDHFGDIIIVADGIGLDCANYAVQGIGTGIGIDVVGRSNVRVINCHVRNFAIGFRIEASSDSVFLYNSASLNTSTTGGFYVKDCPSGILLEMNGSFSNLVGRGFAVRDSSKVQLKSNRASGNGFRGFDIGDSDKIVSTDNAAKQNGSAGFGAFNSTKLVYMNNFVSSSASEGFALLDVTDSRLTGNVALANGASGFRVSSGGSNVFKQNRAEQNGGAGFALSSSGNTLKANSSFFNGPPFDMVDSSCPLPLTNTWMFNSFGSASCLGIN